MVLHALSATDSRAVVAHTGVEEFVADAYALQPPDDGIEAVSLAPGQVFEHPIPALLLHLLARGLIAEGELVPVAGLWASIAPRMDVEVLAALAAVLTFRDDGARVLFRSRLSSEHPDVDELQQALHAEAHDLPTFDEMAAQMGWQADRDTNTGRWMWSNLGNFYRDRAGNAFSISILRNSVVFNQYLPDAGDGRRLTLEEMLPLVQRLVDQYPWLQGFTFFWQQPKGRPEWGTWDVVEFNGLPGMVNLQMIRSRDGALQVATAEETATGELHHRLIDLRARRIIYDLPASVLNETVEPV